MWIKLNAFALVLDIVPLEVRQVTRVTLPCNGIHVPQNNIDGTPGKD